MPGIREAVSPLCGFVIVPSQMSQPETLHVMVKTCAIRLLTTEQRILAVKESLNTAGRRQSCLYIWLKHQTIQLSASHCRLSGAAVEKNLTFKDHLKGASCTTKLFCRFKGPAFKIS